MTAPLPIAAAPTAMLPTPAPVPPIAPPSHPTLAIAAALAAGTVNATETVPAPSTPATIAAAAHDAPSHVLALIILGLVLWALNLALLPRSGVPVGRILRLASPPVPSSTDDLDVELKSPKQVGVEPEVSVSHAALDAAAARSTMWGTLAVACWLGVVVAAAHAFEYVDTYPAVLYTIVLGIVVCPLNIAGMRERYTFLRALGRLFSPNLALPVSLADVILADVLTSFARVFGDWYTSLGPNMPWPDLVVPFLVSVPYLVRFKQCLAELLREHYKPVAVIDEPTTTDDHASDSDTDAVDDTTPPLPQYRRNSHPKPAVRAAYLPLPPTPWHRHLANMVKYASALPVIYLAALRHHEQHRASLATIAIDTSPSVITESAPHTAPPATSTTTTTALLTTAWIASLLVNSLLSFYWDVFLDWSLGRRPVHTRFPTLTRARRQTRTGIYYIAMVVDFILRFLWALRLSALVVPSAAAMSAAEVARRGMWCFLRIESEWCANAARSSAVD
ncbi:protein-ER retention protein [Allomyces arbusculus]|nr:protein-ER retention protein [Allomyces arbusculus]